MGKPNEAEIVVAERLLEAVRACSADLKIKTGKGSKLRERIVLTLVTELREALAERDSGRLGW